MTTLTCQLSVQLGSLSESTKQHEITLESPPK